MRTRAAAEAAAEATASGQARVHEGVDAAGRNEGPTTRSQLNTSTRREVIAVYLNNWVLLGAKLGSQKANIYC